MFLTRGFIFRKKDVRICMAEFVYMQGYKQSCRWNTFFHLQDWHVNKLHHTCMHNRLPEDESSDSKHVDGIVKIKILV